MKHLFTTPIPASSLLLKGMTHDECIELFSSIGVSALKFEKGEAIINQGDALNKYWLIVSGEVHAYIDHGNGKRIVAAVANAGDAIGLLFAYSGIAFHPTKAVATKETIALQFPVILLPQSNEIVSRGLEKRFVSNMLSVMSNAALKSRFRTFVLSHKTVESRIVAYLSRKSELYDTEEFDIPLDRQELADFLDVERTSLCAVLGRMKQKGIIDYRKSHFKLLKRLNCDSVSLLQ